MNQTPLIHQFINRQSGLVETEALIADKTVAFLYNTLREKAPVLFRALTSGRMSSLLGSVHYDLPAPRRLRGQRLLRRLGVNLDECLQPADYYTTYRRVFERQIRYWDLRPMATEPRLVVSPADSRLLIGSLRHASHLFIKEKFFSMPELLGNRASCCRHFQNGDFAVFRLTPDKYHYNHTPVSGTVVECYGADGTYHSCNPAATLSLASIYSKNRRAITVIDTDVAGGTGVGLVAMVEIVALMIGDIVQCYSKTRYDDPAALRPGDFCRRGCPKSLFRPGSSTVVLLFEPGRIAFSPDLQANVSRQDVCSRFSLGLGRPAVETEVKLRSEIARPLTNSIGG